MMGFAGASKIQKIREMSFGDMKSLVLMILGGLEEEIPCDCQDTEKDPDSFIFSTLPAS